LKKIHFSDSQKFPDRGACDIHLYIYLFSDFITGPSTHGVGGQTSNGHWCLSSSSVVVCNTVHSGPAGGFTDAGQAMTSCHLQSNYSCTAGQ